MTKKFFTELADYNIWANNIVCNWLEKISDEQWNQHIVSSFNSIQETILHIVGAEHIWLQRLNREEHTEWLPLSYKGSKNEHINLWKNESLGLKKFVEFFDENNMNANLDFKRINGDAYSMQHYQVLAHVFNHSTYHRGQIVTMLRQVGFTEVSSTDMLGYFRK